MPKKILVIQTAFIGDVILTLPMIHVLKWNVQGSEVDVMCIPSAENIFKNNPDINKLILFDKKGTDKGIRGFRRILGEIKNKYDIIIAPHRSLRTALLVKFSGCKETISFDRSSYNKVYTHKVAYQDNAHEIVRNLSLLAPLGIERKEIIRPELYLSISEREAVERYLESQRIEDYEKFITIAPGSVWFTKAFPEKKFIKMLDFLASVDMKIIFVGGTMDAGLSGILKVGSKNFNLYNAAGRLTILQSAELIRRSSVLVTNDSAPLHIANAVGTKVIALFGATIPEFGFYPIGKDDVIFETKGLKCRPCGIHGGNKCPIETFVCMEKIDEFDVCREILKSA